MTKTIDYRDEVQIPKAHADALRETAYGWHDPAAGQHFYLLRERPVVADGEQKTIEYEEDVDDDGTLETVTDDAIEVEVGAMKTGVAATGDWQSEAAQFASTLNAGLPSTWPEVTPNDVDVK